ncbi:MAG: MotA/TolQ/ExbB proton channel family protein [Gammaproteobacteria bacterium]|nr:MotA/TolQ/ExbB proton channel family protein [Gammaproteobacteria bacterium]MCW8840408.1 MotA/TolQ/ExbB proton channel family protein [Gammaproteobacteria bacterium]MCW8928540.1 MotA/TolQ/ExbB proton channel family protein [Gammaproteobacteria bacterium]MCW8957591.1 MotA/TolQ/ExbB proton channel family protein [Gammaproteobacteria bacterium]MCW8973641.1 MotA/TolQ/ExbB proton channel family protein [Gammaproteobacteria bacterium]
MFELVTAGGWLMVPIILCSIVAVAIIGERFWALKQEKVVPANLVAQIWQLHQRQELDNQRLTLLRDSSPLGRILAAGLVNMQHEREVMKEAIEETGRQVVIELERFLNTLGTIASITPLLGLLGTVIGMIKVFAAITSQGVGNPAVLAGGISEALITTAAGLSVAIPSLMFYRYFRGKVEMLVIKMEEQALKLVEVIHGEREADEGTV